MTGLVFRDARHRQPGGASGRRQEMNRNHSNRRTPRPRGWVPFQRESGSLFRENQQRLKMGPKFRDGGTLFCTAYGRPLDRRVLRVRDHIPRLVRLKLSDARIYDLRHLNITYSVAAGIDPRTVADRAGHKDPGYLIRRYAHAVVAAQERAALVASNLLAKPGLISR
jgi:integrase